MNTSDVFLLLFAVSAVLLILALMWYLGKKCPRCGSRKTTVTKEETYEEVECRKCGLIWAERYE